MNELIIDNKKVIKKLLGIIVTITGAVLLPQLFHAVGIISGTGALMGARFLPMHIPVIIAGFMAGPVVGGTAGAISPIISYAISGMPSQMMLPFMIIELLVYGIAAGMIAKTKIALTAKVLIVQVAGRIVKALAIFAAVYVFGSRIGINTAWTSVIEGIPGIVLQLSIIPLFIYRFRKED